MTGPDRIGRSTTLPAGKSSGGFTSTSTRFASVTVVDHLKPHNGDFLLAFSWENLRAIDQAVSRPQDGERRWRLW
jgi:hypothetical protein